ncbi:phosphotransferase [Lysobacter sp. SG-8]|uniref:Phosphotransferase n=1 Tax=Marilutibacter penaei TaxID=2759900 RepID=A0A7W3U384_9GAMM|nr:phosphotransferase [Lysobacter penaei]MBB1088129.1 phosphotransferase [Lysobacter penaei]
MSLPPDARPDTRLAWLHAVSGDPGLGLERASHDAGHRSYWRTVGTTPSRIVMDSPPGLEDVRPWLAMHALLDSGGVRVPRLLAQDVAAGFLLLEDLGPATLAQQIDARNADALIDAAVDQLLRLQRIPPPPTLAVFGASLLKRDADLFDAWFLRHHLGLELDPADTIRLARVQQRLSDNALAQSRVLTHRDYMLRNLMPADAGPAVLDFQDCVAGPVAYDPVSLFKDAFLSWPLAQVDGWLAHYHARARDAGIPVPPFETFLRDADWLGVQRHLKVLGIFARLHHRDGKSRYLADAPRFFVYLEEVLPRHAALRPLTELLERTIRPAFEHRTGAGS